jgi:hypothetical protein
MRFEGWAGSCLAAYIAASLVRKGQPSGFRIIFVAGNVWGATPTDGAFLAQCQERLGFDFRDLKLFIGFQRKQSARSWKLA